MDDPAVHDADLLDRYYGDRNERRELLALWGFALLMVGSSVALSHAHTMWRLLGVLAMVVGAAIFIVLSSATVRAWWLQMRSRAHR